jgi:hypothetical protein
MVSEQFADVQDDTGRLHFDGWRCLICGEILDPLIVHHRKTRPLPLLNRARLMWLASQASGLTAADSTIEA